MASKPDAMERTILSASPAETKAIAACLAPALREGDVVLLIGGLGAGKTQFAQGLGDGLGVTEPITSPTFNLVFEYRSGRLPLYHFDLYRLDRPEELEDIDFYGLADPSSDGVALIEWAQRFSEEMPEDALQVEILSPESSGEERILRFRADAPRSQELLQSLFEAGEGERGPQHS